MSTTDETEKTPLQPENVKTPDVNRNPKGAGRKPKSYYTRAIQDILDGTARDAAIVLQQLIEQRKGHKTINAGLQRACEYVIDHALGKARPKAEHTGGAMTYKQLADSANNLEKNGRDILADVEEIAEKYTESTPAQTSQT